MDIDKTLLETQLQEVEKVEADEITQEKKDQDKIIREEYKGTTNTLKPVVERLHHLVINEILEKDVPKEVLGEMSNCFLEILDKYIPQADWIGKYGPEIAYIGLIGVVVSSPSKIKKENEQI